MWISSALGDRVENSEGMAPQIKRRCSLQLNLPFPTALYLESDLFSESHQLHPKSDTVGALSSSTTWELSADGIVHLLLLILYFEDTLSLNSGHSSAHFQEGQRGKKVHVKSDYWGLGED